MAQRIGALIAAGGLSLAGIAAAIFHHHPAHHAVAHTAVVSTPPVARVVELHASRSESREPLDDPHVQVARARARAALRARARHAAAERAARLARARAASTSVCNASNWHRMMTWQEVWIDTRESGMDPTPADTNPSSGATTLGQLLPSTFADLGLRISYDPCDELNAQREYIRHRYGSEDNAVAFWRAHNWY